MPRFDLVGFWLPCSLALLYAPRAATSVQWTHALFFVLTGALSYLLPIHHSNGVGLCAFYLLLVMFYLLAWTGRGVNLEKRLPAGPILCLGFLSIAIPDTLLTFERFGASGTVGAMGLSDGLIRFWLFPAPVIVLTWVASEWVLAMDRKASFSWVNSLAFHISPNPSFQRTASGDR